MTARRLPACRSRPGVGDPGQTRRGGELRSERRVPAPADRPLRRRVRSVDGRVRIGRDGPGAAHEAVLPTGARRSLRSTRTFGAGVASCGDVARRTRAANPLDPRARPGSLGWVPCRYPCRARHASPEPACRPGVSSGKPAPRNGSRPVPMRIPPRRTGSSAPRRRPVVHRDRSGLRSVAAGRRSSPAPAIGSPERSVPAV